MYKGLVKQQTTARPKTLTKVQKYGLKNKVHSIRLLGMSGEDSPEYMGPPRPGQSWSQYESFMSMPIAVGASGAMIGAVIAGPVGALIGGIGTWLLTGGPSHTNKPTTQGG